MTRPAAFVLSDDLLRRALTEEASLATVDRAVAGVSTAVSHTPQRRRRAIAWPWTPVLPALDTSVRPRRFSPATLVLLALLLALALAIVGLVASRPRLPAPFGPARTGLLAFTDGDQVVVIGADGSGRRPLTSGPQVSWEPTFSRDGRRIVFWARSADAQARAEAAGPPGTEVTAPADLVVADADGRNTIVLASSFDVKGPPIHGFPYHGFGNPATMSWSVDGRRIVFSEQTIDGPRLAVAETDGSRVQRLDTGPLDASDPAWSPNGSTIAFRGGTFDSGFGVWLIDADGSGSHRVAHLDHVYRPETFAPQWSPDARRIAYSAGVGEFADIWIANADGTAEPRNISDSPRTRDAWPAWSPDGTKVAFVTEVDPGPALTIAAADGPRLSKAIMHVGQDGDFDSGASTPIWSPDGNWISGLVQGGPDAIDDRFVVLDAVGTSRPVTIQGVQVGSGSWQRLAP
jgi:Tol biopolymer transport system component